MGASGLRANGLGDKSLTSPWLQWSSPGFPFRAFQSLEYPPDVFSLSKAELS